MLNEANLLGILTAFFPSSILKGHAIPLHKNRSNGRKRGFQDRGDPPKKKKNSKCHLSWKFSNIQPRNTVYKTWVIAKKLHSLCFYCFFFFLQYLQFWMDAKHRIFLSKVFSSDLKGIQTCTKVKNCFLSSSHFLLFLSFTHPHISCIFQLWKSNSISFFF